MLSKEQKLKQALKMQMAIKSKSEGFVLLEKLDSIEDKVENIKPADLTELKKSIDDLKDKLEEPITAELEII
jgi:hypothetical protein